MPYPFALVGGASLGSGGGSSAYANGPFVHALTQTQIDDGITLSPAPTSINTIRMTLDEQGGGVQSPGTDYTLTGALLEFTAAMKARPIFVGDTIRVEYD